MKLIIIGGVAGGASAAARARRLDEHATITIYDRGAYISFANCGLPYHLGDIIKNRDELILMSPSGFEQKTQVTIKTRHEVSAIDPHKKTVTVRDLASGNEFSDTYDKLILSPGSSPLIPPVPGAKNPKVLCLWTIPDMDQIKSIIDSGINSAVVIGGGFIGVEVAENLAYKGIEVTLVEMLPNILPQLDAEMAAPLHEEMRHHRVKLYLGNGVSEINEQGAKFIVSLQDGTALHTDLVIMAVGVRPNVELAKSANLAIGESGGIQVNSTLQTSNPDIYAVGDAIEVNHLAIGRPARIALAGPAAKQGRIAANNIYGANQAYRGSLGTSICKVFNKSAASTGANETTLQQAGISYLKCYLHPASHASYYPGAEMMHIKVLFNHQERILGAQIVGGQGVDKRIDVIATSIRNGLTITQLEELELCYAPPYGSAKDPINFIGFVANNLLKGHTEIVTPEAIPAEAFVLDVREDFEVARGMIPGAQHIPLGQLRNRLDTLPKDTLIVVYCKVGIRGFNAERILKGNGFSAKNLSGGYLSWQMFQSSRVHRTQPFHEGETNVH